jgi:hypothetical protein
MKSFGYSIERRCYTFINWASNEKYQMRMKVQGHSTTSRAKKAHRILMHRTNKFPSSSWLDVDHWKIGRKISDLRDKKVSIGCMIPRENINKPGAATQAEAAVGAELKTNLCIACFTKETLTIEQGIVPSS